MSVNYSKINYLENYIRIAFVRTCRKVQKQFNDKPYRQFILFIWNKLRKSRFVRVRTAVTCSSEFDMIKNIYDPTNLMFGECLNTSSTSL